MFIRNAGRANNELHAEPGDFIISREGEFVGVIIDHDTSDRGRVKTVKALLFSDGDSWNDAENIPIIRTPGVGYYEDFARSMRDIRLKIPADSRRR